MWCTARFYVKLRASIVTKIHIQFLGFLQSLWWYYQGNFEQSSWKQQSELCQNHGSFSNHQVQGNQLELVELGNDNLIQNSVMDSSHEYVDWDQCSK